MARSLRVSKKYIQQAKNALPRNGFARQKDLAEQLELSSATVWNFLNGRPIDCENFYDICRVLALEAKIIAAELNQDSEEAESEELTSSGEVENQEPIANPTPNQIEHNSLITNFYVERPPIETECYNEILRPGSLIRIKAPQQMGKTLLLDRILAHARTYHYKTVTLSFDLADFTDTNKFSKCFCASVGQSLKLPNKLAEYWDDNFFGSNKNATVYFEEYLLIKLNNPLVLALDKVDLVFQHPTIAGNFFRLLRSWYETAKQSDGRGDIWKKLRLIVVHSTEVYIPLDTNHSPFNVGLAIKLPEFTQEQVQSLAQLYELGWTRTEVKQLTSLVGGHPYLVRKAFDYLKHKQVGLEKFLQIASTEDGPFSNHLKQHLWILRQHSELEAAFRKLITEKKPVRLASDNAFKLNSMGLVEQHNDYCSLRCDLYNQYFSVHLTSK